MGASAAYPKQVKYSTTAGGAGSYTIIGGINNATFWSGREMLDDTAFLASPDAFVSRLHGLKDCRLTITGDYDGSDAGQAAIRTSWGDGSEIWFQYLPNGTAGFKFRGKVESIELSGDVHGKETVNITIQGDGGYATV